VPYEVEHNATEHESFRLAGHELSFKIRLVLRKVDIAYVKCMFFCVYMKALRSCQAKCGSLGTGCKIQECPASRDRSRRHDTPVLDLQLSSVKDYSAMLNAYIW
jgi:hypothetical protein